MEFHFGTYKHTYTYSATYLRTYRLPHVCLHTYIHDWLTIRYDVNYCVIFFYELECDYLVWFQRHTAGGIGEIGRKPYSYLEQESRHSSFSGTSDLILSGVFNVGEHLFVKIGQTVPQGSSSFSGMPICLTDSFMQSFLLPSWAVLVSMTMHENYIERLMWYTRSIHSDNLSCPVKLCSEDHGLNAS